MLSTQRLALLLAVERTGSLTAAARELGCTTSALSQQVAALEREIQGAVLVRGPRGVRLTEAGAVLARHARAVRGQLVIAEREARGVVAGEAGRLRVAAFASAGAALVAPALPAFRALRPQVDVEIEQLEPSESIPRVHAGEADLAVVFTYPVASPPSLDGLASRVLLDDPLLLAVPSGHRLAARPRVRLVDCRDETWVEGRDWGPSVRLLQDACRAAGFDPVIRHHSDDLVLLQALVAAGAGVALLPRLAAAHLLPGVAVVALHRPELARRVLAVTPAGPTAPPPPCSSTPSPRAAAAAAGPAAGAG